MACKNGIFAAPSGHTGIVNKNGFLCLRPGCGKPSWNGEPVAYCSQPCKHTDPPICMQMGCGKPTWNGHLNDYCSKACRDTRICVRPNCGKPTWNGNPNEFCSRRCRQLGPPHVPALPSSQPSVPSGPQSTLTEVVDPDVIQQFQDFVDATHKGPPNNWTRDRGCTIHGVGDTSCSLGCACSNKVPVPTAYEVVKVEMNMNPTLWADYVKARGAIVQECQGGSAPSGGIPYFEVELETSTFPELGKAVGSLPLADGCNEWRLLHGTSRKACKGICETNFSVNLAGSGATWKYPGNNKGTPLYGYGIYLAERITKADEYAKPDGDLFSVLVCRVVGGRAHIIESNDIDVDALQQEITSGRCDSVVGDRITRLNKPFREVVIYNSDQVLPEFLVTYKRL